jgi:putative thiamine transport system ATP-binding protein
VRQWQLQVASGEIHTVMGPSGSGKSSLLGAIVGTLPPGMQFRGSVSLQGRRIDGAAHRAARRSGCCSRTTCCSRT